MKQITTVEQKRTQETALDCNSFRVGLNACSLCNVTGKSGTNIASASPCARNQNHFGLNISFDTEMGRRLSMNQALP